MGRDAKASHLQIKWDEHKVKSVCTTHVKDFFRNPGKTTV